jgi:hypothetical protein
MEGVESFDIYRGEYEKIAGDESMSINGITNEAKTYDSKSTAGEKTKQTKQAASEKQDNSNTAAVYEKSDRTPVDKTGYKTDQDTVKRLMAEAEKRSQDLKDLVERMLRKQGQAFTDATDIYALLREGKVNVDPKTKAQAQKDISEDGYWGVENTSDRLVSFAKALAGGDPSKADEMIDAIKKGYEEATKAWGDDLPGICKDTLDAAISKIEAWRDSEGKAAMDIIKTALIL